MDYYKYLLNCIEITAKNAVDSPIVYANVTYEFNKFMFSGRYIYKVCEYKVMHSKSNYNNPIQKLRFMTTNYSEQGLSEVYQKVNQPMPIPHKSNLNWLLRPLIFSND